MRYSFTRKINLANIDKENYPYETEDIGVTDADSFEEAQQAVDRMVATRIGYYKARAEIAKDKAAPITFPPLPANATSDAASNPGGFPPIVVTPASPTPLEPGVSNQPPQAFET